MAETLMASHILETQSFIHGHYICYNVWMSLFEEELTCQAMMIIRCNGSTLLVD